MESEGGEGRRKGLAQAQHAERGPSGRRQPGHVRPAKQCAVMILHQEQPLGEDAVQCMADERESEREGLGTDANPSLRHVLLPENHPDQAREPAVVRQPPEGMET